MQTLKNRTCIMAGAAGGDGIDSVKALCQGGMNVVMMTHNEEGAKRIAEQINACNYTGRCTYKTGRTKPAEEDEEVLQEVIDEFGSIDVVICNTGGNGNTKGIDEVSKEELMSSIEHLTMSSYGMLKANLPYLRVSKAPRVIFMTSIEGIQGGCIESFSNAVAKGCVEALTINCASRLAKEGITVNAIAKAGITRVGTLHEGEADPRDFLPSIPLKRLGTPKDLAEAICFLASEESSFITGEILHVTGGL